MSERLLTAVEYAAKYRLHPVTVRLRAVQLGGQKILGRWRFPDRIPPGLTPREQGKQQEDICLSNATDQHVGSSVLEEFADLLARRTSKKRNGARSS